MLRGEEVDADNYRKTAQALKSVMVGLGLAQKSRDVTKADQWKLDAHSAAILELEEG